jgi:hypothetical protein
MQTCIVARIFDVAYNISSGFCLNFAQKSAKIQEVQVLALDSQMINTFNLRFLHCVALHLARRQTTCQNF